MKDLSTEFANLSAKQIRCLPMLAVGLAACEVAKKAKVSAIQISSWKHDPNFMAALDTVRREALKDAEIALSGLAMNAVCVLRESLNSSASAQTRLKAAMYITDRVGLSANLEAKPSGAVNMALLLTALGTQPGSPL